MLLTQDLFHWSPEYDRGGAEYEKAATIYKNHKEWMKAIYAYEKCAEANDKASLPTKVAAALDFKAGCHRDAGQVLSCPFKARRLRLHDIRIDSGSGSRLQGC